MRLRLPRSATGGFALVFAWALIIRLVLVLVILPGIPGVFRGFGSSVGMPFDGYREIALHLLAGQGFTLDPAEGPTAARPPLYPFLLAGIYRVFGISTTPVLVVHALLGALACGLLYLLGRRLFDPVIALGGALLFSVNVHHLWWGQYVLSESLLIALQVAAVLALVAFVQQPTGFRAARAGLVFGTTALCNPLILPLPFVLAGAFAMFGRPRAPLLRGTAILLIAMWVVVVPWTVRNHRAFHTFLPVNWGLGFQFVKGSMLAENLRAAPRGSLGQTDLDATRREVEILRARGFAEGTSEEQFRRVHRTMTVNRVEDSVLTAVVREELRRDPASLVRKLSVTWRTFWTFSIRQRDVALVASLMVLGLALAGIVTYTDRRLDRLTALLFGLHLYVSYALVLSVARYSAQVFPVLSLFAAAAVVGVVRRVRGVAGDTVPRRA